MTPHQEDKRPRYLILRNTDASVVDEMLACLEHYWQPVQMHVEDGQVFLLLWPRRESVGLANTAAKEFVQESGLLLDSIEDSLAGQFDGDRCPRRPEKTTFQATMSASGMKR
jgi:hypothetical protein